METAKLEMTVSTISIWHGGDWVIPGIPSRLPLAAGG